MLQRDVPGLTRASIPVLASRGVRGVTGGVNAFSAPPGVPKNTPFIWRDEESGTQLLAMWHPGKFNVASLAAAAAAAAAACSDAGHVAPRHVGRCKSAMLRWRAAAGAEGQEMKQPGVATALCACRTLILP